jgi:hypothetical protein
MTESFHVYINEYKKQLKLGAVQKAYKGLMDYILELRTYFKNKYPAYTVSGSIYYGYMDMTYFSFFPESLKQRNLKIAVVFIHETCRFEIWLAGYNKQVQTKYWQLVKSSGWDKYRVVPTTQGADAIIEFVAVADPDFSDLEALTSQIEHTALQFIEDVENFLAAHDH